MAYGGILHFLALEPVGNAISEDDLQIGQALRMKMKASLQRIHDAGFIHGDVARTFFSVDLEECRRSRNRSKLGDEMSEVDRL